MVLILLKKGNLLADNPETMEKLFTNCKFNIAIHSEKEQILEENEKIKGQPLSVKME